MTVVVRTFKYRLYPTVRQTQALAHLLSVQCEVYNAALEERREAWSRQHVSVTRYDQSAQVKYLHECRPDVMAYGVVVLRGTLRRLELAFDAFFRRVKAGQTPGYPRFRSSRRFDTASWDDRKGWAVKGERLYLQGVGDVKLNVHRPMRGTPKTLRVSRQGRHWYASVCCVDVPANPLPATGRVVGLDLGVASLLTTSDGEHIANPRHLSASAARLAWHQQRLARAKRGSRRRRKVCEAIGATHRKTARQRADHAHKTARSLIDSYDLIVHEDLKVANMVRRAKPKPDLDVPGVFLPNGAAAKSGLNKSIYDAGWGQLVALIGEKAEEAARQVIAIPAPYTSQTCSQCGHVDAGNRVSQAVFRCLACGHEAHADVNAAINILRAGLARRLTA